MRGIGKLAPGLLLLPVAGYRYTVFAFPIMNGSILSSQVILDSLLVTDKTIFAEICLVVG
jgi:hypothetical protein